jgi:hypothetical protein
MAKKLTLKDLKNENKKYEEKKRVMLSDDFYINIYPNFSPIKINELLKETLTEPYQAKEIGINFDKIALNDWLIFNIIAKFSDLGIPDDIHKKIQVFNDLMNTEYWTSIISAFPEESMQKILEATDKYTTGFNEFIKKEYGDTNELTKQES